MSCSAFAAYFSSPALHVFLLRAFCLFGAFSSLIWRVSLALCGMSLGLLWPILGPMRHWHLVFQFANLLGVGKLINAAQPTIAFGISSSDTDTALLYEFALFISFTLCFVFQMF